MKIIESPKNEQIKAIMKLKQSKYQKQSQQYLLEGRHEIQEAVSAKADIELILATDAVLADLQSLGISAQTIQISPAVSQHLSDTKTSQGAFAVMNMPTETMPAHFSGAWLLLADLQDPGNVGTMVRTADAAGFKGVIFSPKTTSVYNSKVLRAMQGSQFHLALFQSELGDVITRFQAQQLPVYGTALDPQALDYRQVTPQNDFALIIGNEGNGIPQTLLKQTDHNLYIPIKGQAESLNAAVAAGITMFALRG